MMMLNLRFLIPATALLAAPTLLLAATLTTIPMQGGMVMPMLSYHAAEGRLHVTLDPAIPQLTPLLASHPGDQFDPADPWFDALDPSREGRAFSRRYGFVMDALSDPLPAGTAIWIRKLSSSPGLAIYRYASSPPKAFEPIFGTDGSPDARAWNGTMFHPVFTATPGTDAYHAMFEAFLVNASGVALPNSSTGPFGLHWTNLPDGRPELAIAQRIVLFWPASATNYVLQGAETLENANWSFVTNAPVMLEGRSAVVLEPDDPRRFFRMQLTP
jgi:hypothetical protein